MEQTYTRIFHALRSKLNISNDEYMLLDMVYHLSQKQDSEHPGWCYATKEYIGKKIGVTRQSIHKYIPKLKLAGLLEVVSDTGCIRTTGLWNSEYVKLKEGKENLHKMSKNLTHDSQESLHNKDIDNKSNNDVVQSGSSRYYPNASSDIGKVVLDIAEYFKALCMKHLTKEPIIGGKGYALIKFRLTKNRFSEEKLKKLLKDWVEEVDYGMDEDKLLQITYALSDFNMNRWIGLN
jgi:biotin operon repressor